MLFHYYLPWKRTESQSPNDALRQVVGLAQWFWILSMYFCYFLIICPWKRGWPFIWTNLNTLNLRMLCAKFGWNWPYGSGRIFFNFPMYFCYFLIISPWKRAWPFFWTNLNTLNPRMLCAKFGWNWPVPTACGGTGEEIL